MVSLGDIKEATNPQNPYHMSAVPMISQPGSLHTVDRYRVGGHAITGIPAPIQFQISFCPTFLRC